MLIFIILYGLINTVSNETADSLQAGQEIICILWNQEVYYVHKNPLVDPDLSRFTQF